MLLILPPSETKRDGGDERRSLDLSALGFLSLNSQRQQAVRALRELVRSRAAASEALGLGPTQQAEVTRNREVATSPVLPALDRYTGVVYDAVDAASLGAVARGFAAEHLVIGSALFGLLRAEDPIPAYRLSHDSRLPGLSLRRHWRAAVSAVLAEQHGVVIDLRSEAYTALGPAPTRPESYYLRVVSEAADGRRAALSHFNKKAKGEFARRLLDAAIDHPSGASLLEWAAGEGIRLEPGVTGELDLVV